MQAKFITPSNIGVQTRFIASLNKIMQVRFIASSNITRTDAIYRVSIKNHAGAIYNNSDAINRISTKYTCRRNLSCPQISAYRRDLSRLYINSCRCDLSCPHKNNAGAIYRAPTYHPYRRDLSRLQINSCRCDLK